MKRYQLYENLSKGKQNKLLKQYPTITTQYIQSLNTTDPTPTGKYTPWLTREYVKGRITTKNRLGGLLMLVS